MAMRRRRLATAAVWFLGLLALAVLGSHFLRTTPPPPGSTTASRLSELRKLIEDQEKESATAVATYAPKTAAARLDDLTASPESVFKELPGVAHVEVAIQAENPTHLIVHLRDWHYVPKDLYAIDLRNSAGRPLTDDEVDRLHEELCLEVEAVQLEQMAVLRCLIKHHGLRRIFCEGLTEKDLPNYKEKIAVLRSMEKEQIPQLREQLEEVRELKKGMEAAGREKTEGYEKAKAIEKEIASLIWQHRLNLLELGAPGRLLIAGEIEDVFPLDDAEILEQAKPITPVGKVKLDPAKLAARRDAIVKAATAKEPFALIVLGGSHDLTDSVRRVGGGRCEYIRVTTSRSRELFDE
jgi:hypothetical protein